MQQRQQQKIYPLHELIMKIQKQESELNSLCEVVTISRKNKYQNNIS